MLCLLGMLCLSASADMSLRVNGYKVFVCDFKGNKVFVYG